MAGIHVPKIRRFCILSIFYCGNWNVEILRTFFFAQLGGVMSIHDLSVVSKWPFSNRKKIRQMSSLNSVLIWVLRSTIIGNFVANIKVHTFRYFNFKLFTGFEYEKTNQKLKVKLISKWFFFWYSQFSQKLNCIMVPQVELFSFVFGEN